MKAKYGVYAVYGNHDVEETLFGGFPISPISQAFRSREMEQFFEDSGFADFRIVDEEGLELALLETQAYETQTILYSSPLLQKGSTYTLLTGDTLDALEELTTIQAE